MGAHWGAVFSRQPGAVSIEGVQAANLAQLRETLACGAESDPVIACDLTLGAWRGNQAAHEWCEQLGLAAPEPAHHPMTFRRGQGDALVYADTVGQLVDSETKGDRPVLAALETAERIVRHVRESGPHIFLALAPRFGLTWEPENLLFLRFAAQGLAQTSSRLIIVSDPSNDNGIPGDWTIRWIEGSASRDTAHREVDELSLFPGTIPAGLSSSFPQAAGEDRMLALAGGSFLVDPHWRTDPRSVSRLVFDRLALRFPQNGPIEAGQWIKAYAQYFGNAIYCDSYFLCEQAEERFAEGGYDIAFRLLERAAARAQTPMARALAQAAAQGMRIAIHRFHDAAAAPDPAPSAPAQMRQFLAQSKGWGLVMTGRATEASAYFQSALQHGTHPGTERERLYLENIAALSSARMGDVQAALQAEKQIEESRQALPAPDWHLEYINCLNLARLYRRMRDYATARTYYERAFATMQGGRSESDGLYVNVTFAQLASEEADQERGKIHWLRAALHWMSGLAPEALAWRVATAVLGRKVGASEIVTEEVSAHLAARLQESFPIPMLPEGPVPVFTRVVDELPVVGAVGSAGWSVFLSDAPVSPASLGAEYTRLRRLLFGILMSLCPSPNLRRATTLGVFDRQGCEMAESQAELVESCLQLGVRDLRFGNEAIRLDKAQLERHLEFRLAPIVASIADQDGIVEVRFKRYFPSVRLEPLAAAMVARLEGSREFRRWTGPQETVGLLRDLRIVETRLSWLFEEPMKENGPEPMDQPASVGVSV
jgi:tetratricopeptide (TPR) repeat protein